MVVMAAVVQKARALKMRRRVTPTVYVTGNSGNEVGCLV
jgi:hypothetical protein